MPLTRKEFGVLEALLGADGAVVSAEELLESVWDEHADPFTQHGLGHHGPAAAQARRSAGDRDGDRQRLPAPGPLRPARAARAAGRRPIRLRLTLIYSGLFLLAGAMLLAFTYVFVVRGLQPPGALKTPPAPSLAVARKSCAQGDEGTADRRPAT